MKEGETLQGKIIKEKTRSTSIFGKRLDFSHYHCLFYSFHINEKAKSFYSERSITKNKIKKLKKKQTKPINKKEKSKKNIKQNRIYLMRIIIYLNNNFSAT